MRNFLVVKSEDNKSVRRHRYRCRHKVIINFKDKTWEVVDLIGLDQDGNH